MGNIFISYRRHDVPRQARALYRFLSERFTVDSVFFDVREQFEPGREFAAALRERIETADAALIVIGPDWNPAVRGAGRRLDDTRDYVRLELTTALASPISVIPVLVGGARMPSAQELPPRLRAITRKQAVVLDRRRFTVAAADLTRELEAIRSLSLAADSLSSTPEHGILRLSIVDANGETIGAPATLVLRSEETGRIQEFRDVPVSHRVIIRGLSDRADNRYLLDVRLPHRRTVRWVLTAAPWKSDAVTRIHVPVNPERVQRAAFPSFDALPEHVRRLCERGRNGARGARAFYRALPAPERGNLLNCCARAASLALDEDLTLLHLFDSAAARLIDLRPDRLRIAIDAAAGARIAQSFDSGALMPVSATLHAPPPAYDVVRSAKTPDPMLALQITLFKGAADYLVELDFDEMQGLGCIFRVVNEERFSNVGHPYNVHQLLVRHNDIDPGYTLGTSAPKRQQSARVGGVKRLGTTRGRRQ